MKNIQLAFSSHNPFDTEGIKKQEFIDIEKNMSILAKLDG